MSPWHRVPGRPATAPGAPLCMEPAQQSYRGVLIATLFWTALGTALFFALSGLLAGDQGAGGTLCSAFCSGALGVLVGSLGLRKLPGYRMLLLLLLGAYLLRVALGVALYLNTHDSDYFNGGGKYVDSNWEFRWTYENVKNAADILAKGENPLKSRMMDPRVDKNPFIHLWMGCFLATGPSRHALDLTPFNAFHHIIAGILLVGMALSCGYSSRVSLYSGALLAWVPWAFPASLMWRDSVGLTWVVLAIALLCVGRQLGTLATLVLAIPAACLAWADRAAYLAAIALICCLSLVYDQQKSVRANSWKGPRLALILVLVAAGALVLAPHIGALAFARHEQQATGGYASSRVVLVPLLVLRALAGPFPWFNGGQVNPYVVFDYLFHLVQFALFLIYLVHWRIILSRANILTYSAAIFWFMAFISGGVHTAYLAVAFPFLLPPVLDTGASLGKYLLFSGAGFLVANVLWISFGLAGSGLVLGTTGY